MDDQRVDRASGWLGTITSSIAHAITLFVVLTLAVATVAATIEFFAPSYTRWIERGANWAWVLLQIFAFGPRLYHRAAVRAKHYTLRQLLLLMTAIAVLLGLGGWLIRK